MDKTRDTFNDSQFGNSPPNSSSQMPNQNPNQKKSGCLKTLGIILLTIAITVAITYWFITSYLFPQSFDPVALNQKEESVLVHKLRQLGIQAEPAQIPSQIQGKDNSSSDPATLEPEPYSEVGAKREVAFNERELNAMLAKNTDLSDKLAIDLANNLASAKLLLPLDPDFPIFGGKTLKASAGMELSYEKGRPIVILKGVSVWGVPIPNSWLGGIKNVDLIKEFGADEGFWKSFADGIEHINVAEGKLLIKLKE